MSKVRLGKSQFAMLLISAAIASAAWPSVARADGGLSAAAVVLINETASQLRDLGSSGDLKMAVLNGSGCGRSKKDGENRGARLARYYRELLQAAQGGDPNLIHERAARLKEWVNKSSMYQNCFNAMGNASKAMAAVDQILAAKDKK
jgi:hypothetical protein